MKIKRSQGPGNTTAAGKAAKSGQTSALDFRHLLQAQMEGMPEVRAAAPTAQVEERQQGNPALRLQGVRMTETTIDSLEAFATALDNAGLSSQDLEPFITALEEVSQGLLDIKEQLPANDPLTALIEQVAAAAYLETAKYRRGDYEG